VCEVGDDLKHPKLKLVLLYSFYSLYSSYLPGCVVAIKAVAAAPPVVAHAVLQRRHKDAFSRVDPGKCLHILWCHRHLVRSIQRHQHDAINGGGGEDGSGCVRIGQGIELGL
jgi:hypothetical protein